MSPQAPKRPTVLHYCQHSVGLGHLVRSLSVAGSLAESFRVVLVSGGQVPSELSVPAGVELVALPPIGSATGGSRLMSLGHPGGLGPVGLGPSGFDLGSFGPRAPGASEGGSLEQAWDARLSILLETLEELSPDVLVVEMFPLGRRKFARELLPLLGAARLLSPPALTVCSVRDILVRGGADQQARDDEAASRLNDHFDALVVHGDERLSRLEETFRPSLAVRVPVCYSGFVVPRATQLPPRRQEGAADVVVSAGGGLVGGVLLRHAAAAHCAVLEPLGLRTQLVTGPFLPSADVAALESEARRCGGLTVERFVSDLCGTISGAAVSVSQCGYNTALDLLRAGVPSLVVPYDAGKETEQAERARRLAALGAVRVLPFAELSPARLADEVLRLLGTETPAIDLNLDGAATTAAIVNGLLDRSTRKALSGAAS